MIFLETFVFKLTSHPKSAFATVTATPDFFPKKKYVMYLVLRTHDIYLFCRKVMLPTLSATFILCFTIIVFQKYNSRIQLLEDLLIELQKQAWFDLTNYY